VITAEPRPPATLFHPGGVRRPLASHSYMSPIFRPPATTAARPRRDQTPPAGNSPNEGEGAGREDAFGVLPIELLIVGDISEVTKLHRQPCTLDPSGKIPHRRTVAEHGINPFVFEPIQELSEHGEYVPETFGQGTINVIFDRPGIAQTQNVDIVARLA
jgi:hypothetical protein